MLHLFPLGGKGQPIKILLKVHFDNPNKLNGQPKFIECCI